MLKPFPFHWCLQYDWMWLNKTFIQVKLFFICGIVCSIPFWYHLCYHFLSQWWQLNGCSKMRSQVVLLDEFFITVVAVECFFTSVKHFMHSQIVLLDEFLVTVVAIEWLSSNALSGCPSGRFSYHSGGSWMVFHQCEAFHALSGCPSGWISCNSWFVISRAFIKWLHFSTWLNFLDWISDLMVINECMPVNNKLS